MSRRQVQALGNAVCLTGLLQRTGFLIDREGSDGATHFTDDIQKLAVGRKGQVARAGIVGNGDIALADGDELSVLGLQSVLQHTIDAQVASVHKPVARIGAHRMRVHAGLVSLNAVARAVLRVDGLDAEQVGTIGRAEQEASAAIGRQVGQTLGQRCLTQRLEVPRSRFDAETQHLIRFGAQRRE